jgi:UDP-N-acetylglucosamine 4,6-dehydratase
MLKGKTILITGGTGSFGKAFLEEIILNHSPKKVIIFSRDEYKQHLLSKKYPPSLYPIRFFIGDIRDKDRLYRAFEGVDIVVHTAALKHVPLCEYNPIEAVNTNILGAQNIINAAIDKGVKKVIAISTDKAVNPINLYGATKLVMEKLLIAANAYVGTKNTLFSVVRYGNVIGSRGSVVEYFLSLKKEGINEFPITDIRMTRFWITLKQAVNFVIEAIDEAVGGEIFVPKIPSMKLIDLVKAIEPECKIKIIGIRPGEKIHETLISEDEARHTYIYKNRFVILPQFGWKNHKLEKYKKGKKVEDGFIYRSDVNPDILTISELKKIIQKFQPQIS